MAGKPGKKVARRFRARCEFGATLAGVLFAAILAVIGLAAVNTQRSLLFVIFGLMVGAFLTSVLIAWRMLAWVDVCRDMPERAFANRVVYLGYVLRNRGRKPVLALEVREVRPPPALESVEAYCVHLSAGAAFKSGSRFLVRRRGRFTLSGVRVSTRFPFSLLRTQRLFPQAMSLVVWPALGELRADMLARGAAEISDAAPARAQSGDDEFFGLREYRQGDNPRWIHWKRTASTGAPVVREMSKPPPDTLFVVLDTALEDLSAPSLHWREQLIRFVATLTEHSFRREYRIGLALAYREGVRVLRPAAGRGQRIAVLDALADVDLNRDRPFPHVLAALPRRLLRQAHVVAVGTNLRGLGPLTDLRAASRRLTVVTPENLAHYFEDVAPAGWDGERALEPAPAAASEARPGGAATAGSEAS